MRLRALLAIAWMATLVAVPSAGAATFTVTTTSDGTASCDGTTCTTLRAAVVEAQRMSGPDTIRLDASTYTVSSALSVASQLTIAGVRADSTTVRGDGKSSRVFDVVTGGQLGIQHATVSNGFAEAAGDIGGDIRVGADTQLSLDHVRVAAGASVQGGGIGIGSGATVQITRSLIDGNHATTSGGAIVAAGNVKDATGGIRLVISDSTITGNTASTRAGILAQNDTRNVTSLVRSTVASNSAGSNDGGAGIDVTDAETFTVTASIISGNTGDGVADNCGAALTSGGSNVDSGARCGLATKTDRQNTDPQLGVLTAGLGETPVLPIASLSPAVDLLPVSDRNCTGADQRDLGRPQGTGCDAGAFEVDQAPDTTITSGPSQPINSPSASFEFTSGEPGATFQCRLDGPGGATGTFSACTTPRDYTKLADGSYTFQVRALDGTGHVDDTPATRSFSVDTTPPTVSITGGPSGPTNVTSPSFPFTTGGGATTVQCRLDGAGTTGTFSACTSPKAYTALADGDYTFFVRATDAVGNSATATRGFNVDTIAPDTTLTPITTPTKDSTPTFSFTASANGATFQCKVDGAAFASCTSPFTPAALADGSHTLQVRATDQAGNTDATPASQTFVVDTVSPVVNVTGGPAGPTNDASPSFPFTVDDAAASVQCELDGPDANAGDPVPCSSPKAYGSLSDGAYMLTVRATDAAGNSGSAARTFTLDTVAPVVSITGGPSGATGDASPSFPFTVDDASASVQCLLDGVAVNGCSSPKAYSSLADGPHTFKVEATDAAHNSGSDTKSFTLDTGAPSTTITSGPAGATNSASPSFGFTANDSNATFTCRLDRPSGPGTFTSCASPQAYGPLADGTYTFSVRATDAAGNTDASPATQAFTVDTTPPPADVTSGPEGTTTDGSPSFGFASPDSGATFDCRLDGPGATVGAYGPCASPRSFSGLTPGDYLFRLRARDSAGNTTETSRAFTVQAAQPPTPTPTPQETVVVAPVKGRTLIKLPGSKRFVRLDVTKGIPLGSVVDARDSRVRLSAIRRAGRPVETALFYGGIFKVTQTSAVTQLQLVQQLSCPTPGHASAARKRRSRRLWGDGHGQFRTRGQYSSATVRGTKWLVQDSCGATLTKVARGVVAVNDLVKHKTVKVPAGHRYVARARRG